MKTKHFFAIPLCEVMIDGFENPLVVKNDETEKVIDNLHVDKDKLDEYFKEIKKIICTCTSNSHIEVLAKQGEYVIDLMEQSLPNSTPICFVKVVAEQEEVLKIACKICRELNVDPDFIKIPCKGVDTTMFNVSFNGNIEEVAAMWQEISTRVYNDTGVFIPAMLKPNDNGGVCVYGLEYEAKLSSLGFIFSEQDECDFYLPSEDHKTTVPEEVEKFLSEDVGYVVEELTLEDLVDVQESEKLSTTLDEEKPFFLTVSIESEDTGKNQFWLIHQEDITQVDDNVDFKEVSILEEIESYLKNGCRVFFITTSTEYKIFSSDFIIDWQQAISEIINELGKDYPWNSLEFSKVDLVDIVK